MTEEVKPEVTPEAPAPEAPQYSAEETRALQDGWKPLEVWTEAGNDPKDHRSAREYNDRGELLKRISEQTRYIQKTNQSMERLAQHNSKVYEAAYQKALVDLKAQHSKAVEDGNLAAADQIVDQISNEKARFAAQQTAARIEQQQQPQGTPPELAEWKARNTWYEQDEDLRTTADAMGFKFVQSRGGQVTPMEVLAHVERKMNERFVKPTQPKIAAPDPVAPARQNRQPSQAAGKLRKSDLDENELRAMKDFVHHKLGSEADYMKQLEDIK